MYCFIHLTVASIVKRLKYLVDKGLINRDQIVDAVEVTDEQLLRVHTRGYLDALNNDSAATMTRCREFHQLVISPNKVCF